MKYALYDDRQIRHYSQVKVITTEHLKTLILGLRIRFSSL